MSRMMFSASLYLIERPVDYQLLNHGFSPHIGHARRDVKLCSGVEVGLSASYGRTQALVLHSESK